MLLPQALNGVCHPAVKGVGGQSAFKGLHALRYEGAVPVEAFLKDLLCLAVTALQLKEGGMGLIQ